MKLQISKLFFVILFYPLFSFSEKLSTISDYLNKRVLSKNNIQFNFGISILTPPHSFKNSFAQNKILEFIYRRESKKEYIPPILLKIETRHRTKQLLQSLSMYSGIQFPKTHRKTPIYFGLSLGTLWNIHKKKLSFLLQISSSIRLYQLTPSTSALIHLNANYNLGQSQWWRVPSSLALSAGLNMNI